VAHTGTDSAVPDVPRQTGAVVYPGAGFRAVRPRTCLAILCRESCRTSACEVPRLPPCGDAGGTILALVSDTPIFNKSGIVEFNNNNNNNNNNTNNKKKNSRMPTVKLKGPGGDSGSIFGGVPWVIVIDLEVPDAGGGGIAHGVDPGERVADCGAGVRGPIAATNKAGRRVAGVIIKESHGGDLGGGAQCGGRGLSPLRGVVVVDWNAVEAVAPAHGSILVGTRKDGESGVPARREENQFNVSGVGRLDDGNEDQGHGPVKLGNRRGEDRDARAKAVLVGRHQVGHGLLVKVGTQHSIGTVGAAGARWAGAGVVPLLPAMRKAGCAT